MIYYFYLFIFFIERIIQYELFNTSDFLVFFNMKKMKFILLFVKLNLILIKSINHKI